MSATRTYQSLARVEAQTGAVRFARSEALNGVCQELQRESWTIVLDTDLEGVAGLRGFDEDCNGCRTVLSIAFTGIHNQVLQDAMQVERASSHADTHAFAL